MASSDDEAEKIDYKLRQGDKSRLPDDDPTIDKWKLDPFLPEDNKGGPVCAAAHKFALSTLAH